MQVYNYTHEFNIIIMTIIISIIVTYIVIFTIALH